MFIKLLKNKFSRDKSLEILFANTLANILISFYLYFYYRFFSKFSNKLKNNFYNFVLDSEINIKFNLFLEFSKKNNEFVISDLFFIMLKIRTIKIDKLLNKNILYFFDHSNGNYVYRKKKLISFLKSVNCSVVNIYGWKIIYLFFISIKENEISSYIFVKIQQVILKIDSSNNDTYNKKITNTFFLIDKSNKKKQIKEYFENINYTKENENFLKFVKAKRIAIIGPANTKYKINLNEFDIIIRFNVRNNKNIFKKIDIVYFNHTKSSTLKNFNFLNSYQTKFVIFKNSKKISNQNLQTRKIHSFNMGIYNQLNMLQSCILDLLIYQPKFIKLYNFSFFINIENKYYEKDYQVKKYKNLKIEEMFVKQNPLTQFLLIKNLYNNGLIDLDENLIKIIKLSYLNFSKKLDENFIKY